MSPITAVSNGIEKYLSTTKCFISKKGKEHKKAGNSLAFILYSLNKLSNNLFIFTIQFGFETESE